MLGVLGAKRIAVIVFLLCLNVVLGASVYMYLIPHEMKQNGKLNALRREVSTARADIARMEVEFEQIQDQKAEFEALEKKGFFKNQSRRQAEDAFGRIQKDSGVNAAVASISAGNLEDNAEAKKAKHKILSSPVQIKLEAIDDVDLFHYFFLVGNYFPGHVTVEKVEIKRQADVSGTVLRGIASGKNPPLVTATVDVLWRTMIPEGDAVNADEARGQ